MEVKKFNKKKCPAACLCNKFLHKLLLKFFVGYKTIIKVTVINNV